MSQPIKDGKLFYFGNQAKQYLLEGAETVYQAVSLTYGPKGQNVILEKTYGTPVVTRDGVTVAKESYLEDRPRNLGTQMLIEAAEMTNHYAGDGTTATVILAYNLIQHGQFKSAAGVHTMQICDQLKKDSYVLLNKLKELSKPIKKGQLEQVASVSCGDPALGRLIAEAVEKVGSDGGLVTEKAPVEGVERSYVNGYFLQQGFTALAQGKKDLENPYMVVTSKSITSRMDAINLLNKIGERAHHDQKLPVTQNGQPVPLQQALQIAFFGEIDGEAYNVLVANINQGIFDGTITKTPPAGMGEHYMEDLAIYCGGKAIKAGENLSSVDGDYFGRADRVMATSAETSVYGGQGAGEDIERRKKEIKEQLELETAAPIQEKLRDRLAKLEGRIAKFRIGGATDTEKEELEFRVEDAIQATRAAASSGVVAGGGRTLIELAQCEVDEIWQMALYRTFQKLLRNADLESEVKLAEVRSAEYPLAYNLKAEDKLVDMIKEGILDPTLVLEQVIENAASAAVNVLKAGALITFIDKEKE